MLVVADAGVEDRGVMTAFMQALGLRRNRAAGRSVNRQVDFKSETNEKLPDALRLSGLQCVLQLLISLDLVGRIRRLRRIRHEQRTRY